MFLEQPAELVEGECFVDWRVIEFANFTKELFHPARRLVNMDRCAGLVSRRHPYMRDFAGNEHTLTRAATELSLANFKVHGAGNNV